MPHLNIVYGYCENAQKAQFFEQLVQTTSVVKVKTIGNIADKAVFAALSSAYSSSFFQFPLIDGINWVRYAIPTKKKSTFTKPILNQTYRKQRNHILTEKNWRQHINKKVALHEVNVDLNTPYQPVLSPPHH